MLKGMLYADTDPDLTRQRDETLRLVTMFNRELDEDRRRALLSQFLGGIDETSTILPPFNCDYGRFITIGKASFLNYNCTILDCGRVTIGDNVLIGPNVQIIATSHPTDPVIRKQLEYGGSVVIKNGAWIGAGAIIFMGVTVGENAVVGACSVVRHDVPDNVVVAGNPARVMRAVSRHEGWDPSVRDVEID